MAAIKPRTYYQTLGQFREFDKAFPVHPVNWPVPDKASSYLHFHNGLEFGLCRSGQGIFVIADKIKPFRTGDISVIDRNERHYAQSVPGVTSDWTWAQMDVIGLLAPLCRDMSAVDPAPLRGPGFPNIFSPDSHPVLCSLMARFFSELWGSRPHREVVIRAIVLEIMIELRRMKGLETAPPADMVHSTIERIAPALNHIAGNYPQLISVKELARLCFLSENQFCRVFTRETGKTPRRYILETRVGMASAMLRESSRPIGRIAAECGFQTLSSFNRAFRDIAKTTPRDWRAGQLSG